MAFIFKKKLRYKTTPSPSFERRGAFVPLFFKEGLGVIFKRFFLCVCMCLCALCTQAQIQTQAQTPLYGRIICIQKQPFFIEKGFITGLGLGFNALQVPEGNYQIWYLQAKFSHELRRKRRNKNNPNIFGRALLTFEPQINPVFIVSGQNKDFKNEIEFGLSVGLQQNFIINQTFEAYIMGSIAPFFTSVHTTRQARGFIFADNIGLGTYIYLKKNKQLALNLGFRLRHLSNANTRTPNFGINTRNYLIGISWFWGKFI